MFKDKTIHPAWRAFAGRLLTAAALAVFAAWAAGGDRLARWVYGHNEDLAIWVNGTQVDLPVLGSTGIDVLTALVAGAIAGLIVLTVAYTRFSYRWRLGEHAVYASTGVIATEERSMQYRNIRIPTVRRGILERLLMVGTVEMSSAGGGSEGEIHMQHVSNPMRIKRELMDRIRAERGEA
ncbi:PH domain-containing protein [Thioalkalivibrio sp. ALE16]|uniref:PH domain-containing protein n=1 Tax=Thioalkalivibrio sp. ALE16 TaxID=1158172 RepID=UPI000377EFF1|nr:PH domain-containing protein [Thioalkalivibrio sp. ALE16]